MIKKLALRTLNFFAKLSLNVSIGLALILLIIACVRMIVLELNINELENEVIYYHTQKPQKKPSSTKPI